MGPLREAAVRSQGGGPFWGNRHCRPPSRPPQRQADATGPTPKGPQAAGSCYRAPIGHCRPASSLPYEFLEMPGLAGTAATPAAHLTTPAVPVRVTALRVLAGELGDAHSGQTRLW